MNSWHSLSGAIADRLPETRIQIHHALQVLAAAGQALVPARPDYTHTALRYDPDGNALIGAVLGSGGDSGLRVAFRFGTAELVLQAGGGSPEIVARQAIAGQTLPALFAWLKQALNEQSLKPGELVMPEYGDFPEHALATGSERFALEDDVVAGLHAYFENTAPLLSEIAAQHAGASPVTLWPHHFDMATLITLREPSEAGGEDGQSVGAGISPGDGGNPLPYWYVTPWPYPDVASLPKLSAGRWNTDGWVGAQLDAQEVFALPADQQAAAVRAFLTEAVQASVDLIRAA